jgi:putative copper export protein
VELWLEVGAKLVVYGALLMLLGALGLRWLLLPRLAPAFADLGAGRTPAHGGAAASERAALDEARRTADRLVLRCAIVLLVGLLLRAVAHTVAAFGVADGLSPENLTLIAIESQWGERWRLQALAALVLVATAVLGLSQPPARIVSGAVALLLCFLVPGLGHAAGEPDRVAIHGIHIVAGGLWLGTLATVVTSRAAAVQRVRPRLLEAFAPVAMTCVALLAATGAFAAWTYLGPVSNLWTTEYGRLLGVKLIVVLDALALGGINWFFIHRRRQPPPAGVAVAEVVCAAAIVLLTAWLTETGHP